MEIKVGKFYEKLKPLTIMNNTMKIHPTFIEEHKRVVDRNIIIHSHETFSNVVDKNYNKSYIDSFYDMLFNNHKNYSEMRQNLKLKQSNKNNSNIENNNLSEQILPSINKNKINLSKEKKGKSFEIIKKRKNAVSKIKKYKRIKDNDEVYNTVLRLNDDNKRLFSFLVSGEKIRREYENKFINHLNRKLRLYSFIMNNLKPIKYNSIFIPSFIKSNNFFL
jgi:ATPase subunit of ABC transporter with duplicated ATPase domains